MQNTKFNQEEAGLLGKRFIYQEYKPINLAAQQEALEAVKEQEKEAVMSGISVDQAEKDAKIAIDVIVKAIPDPMFADLDAEEMVTQKELHNQVKDAANAAKRAIEQARENLKKMEAQVTIGTQIESNFTGMTAEIDGEKKIASNMEKLTTADYPADSPVEVGDLKTAVKNIGDQFSKIDNTLGNLQSMIKGLEGIKDPVIKAKFDGVLVKMKTEQALLANYRDSLITVSTTLSGHLAEQQKAAEAKVKETQQKSGQLQQRLNTAKENVPADLQANAQKAYDDYKAAQALVAAYKPTTDNEKNKVA